MKMLFVASVGMAAMVGWGAVSIYQATPETLWTQYAAATNAAGSVLALAAGRYVLDRPLVFTQGVALRGATDGETVLDGADKADRLVEIVHAGKDAFVFENLTFTHAKKQALAKGHVPYRGRGGLAVRNCRFRANGVGWNAGYVPAGRALYTSCASVTWGATTEIANCRFEDNAYFPAEKDGKGGKGGAVYIAGQSRAQLADCAFLRNGYSAELGEDAARYAGVMSGAALWAVNSPVTLERCVFDGNRSISMNENGWMYDSSAVMLENSQTHVPWTCAVTECRFTGNRSFSPNQWTGSSPTAGALFISDSVGATTATVTRCAFRNNHFDTAAGTAGVGVFGGNVILAQCTFEGNKTRPKAIGADVKATGRFAAVPARKTYVDVRDCAFPADANRVAAAGGAQLVPYALANPARTYCNRCFKGLRTVWPEHVGYGDLRFENCRADEAPGIAPEWARPICVETNRYIGWPTICRRKNGELIAVFSGDRTAHVSNDGKVQAVRSQDGGKTWSAPETWVNSAVDDRDSGLVELSDGTLVLFYFSSVCYAGTGYAKDFEKRIGCDYATAKASVGAFCRRSTDGGKTWGDPVRLRGIAPHGACVTKDGRLVLVSRCQRGEGNVLENDPAWETTKFALYVETSEDGGKSWTLRHSFEVPKGVDITKIHEPHVVEAADGSLVAQFRTSLFEGVLLQSVSKDGGSNWSPLAPTTLHGHPAHLIRLADGRLLTTYGRRADHLEGGSGVYVALSSDNGRSWGRELKISNNAYNVYNFGYPATADLGDGAFLTVCYQQVAENDRPCLMAVRWHLADAPAAELVHTLRYARPAADTLRGWERESLPLGCAHFGANVFGDVERERVQITHNAVQTGRDKDRECGNLTDALEIRIDFKPKATGAYERGLDLEPGLAWVNYEADWTKFRREYFTSYPAKTLAMRFTCAEKGRVGFTLRPEIPFRAPFKAQGGDGLFGRRGTVTASGGRIVVDQELEFFGVKFACRLAVVNEGGKLTDDGKSVTVEGADAATVYFTCDTNYRLRPETFDAPRGEKLDPNDNPGARADQLLAAAVAKGWQKLKSEHEADLQAILGRAAIDLGADPCDAQLPTDALLQGVRNGRASAYLEETYWQFGRYLLVASSRPGSLPANLQGVWSAHKKSPWGCGYWHNINVQMNYWPAFNANLAECFVPYAEFNAAFRPGTRKLALEYLKRHGLEDLPKDGEASDMWCVGTAVWPYYVEGGPGSHSGPGTGGLTTKVFADWYDFTLDRTALEQYVWPTIHGMGDFLTRCVIETNGLFLSKFSASPEQMVGHLEDHFRWGVDTAQYYTTVGCAFDQQMIAENNADLLRFAKILGIEDAVVAKARAQAGKYAPVEIGASGQIKEFREEVNYSDIGQAHHRHISQLVCVMPGTLVTRETPEWMKAARKTLDFRGDESTGWALAHRLNARARTGEGDRAYRLLKNLLAQRTFDNLWDAHPPFQIDGNFGATAGITEMLVQSHAGYIDLLPALPKAWAKRGSFRGLCARGAFEVDCAWADGVPTAVSVRSKKGLKADVRFRGKPFQGLLILR